MAICQSSFTVSGETPSSCAISECAMSAKNFISTTRAMPSMELVQINQRTLDFEHQLVVCWIDDALALHRVTLTAGPSSFRAGKIAADVSHTGCSDGQKVGPVPEFLRSEPTKSKIMFNHENTGINDRKVCASRKRMGADDQRIVHAAEDFVCYGGIAARKALKQVSRFCIRFSGAP